MVVDRKGPVPRLAFPVPNPIPMPRSVTVARGYLLLIDRENPLSSPRRRG